jgi:uncharacterized protein (UPF0276 family)
MIHGIGLGLRQPIAEATLAEAPAALRWLEIHPENYMRRAGRYESMLRAAEARFPILTHGLTMSFGSVARFDRAYLRDVRALLERVQAPWHSDHLCFSHVDGAYLHDLLPLPLNPESLAVAVDRIREAQDALGVPIAVEHISFYAQPRGTVMDEVDHLREILERADAKLLLDVNNVYVNAHNHGFDARAFIDRLPLERVVQLHVAGHLMRDDGLWIDTHAEPVCEGVYELFAYTMGKLARKLPVLLERDDNYPPFAELSREIERLDRIYHRALRDAEATVPLSIPPAAKLSVRP